MNNAAEPLIGSMKRSGVTAPAVDSTGMKPSPGQGALRKAIFAYPFQKSGVGSRAISIRVKGESIGDDQQKPVTKSLPASIGKMFRNTLALIKQSRIIH